MSVNIDDIKRKLLVKYPTFGSVIAKLEFQESEGIGTAGTDGKVVLYDPKFVSRLSDKETTFLFAHEVCHVAFEHIFRSEGKDSRLWNIATDAVINALLKQDGLPMIEGGVNIPEAVNYDAEEMYNKLLEEKKKNQEQQGAKGNQSQQSSQGNQGQQNSQGSQGEQSSEENQEKQNSQGGQGEQSSEENQEKQNSQGGQGEQSSEKNQEKQNSQGGQGEQSSEENQEQQNSQGGQGEQSSEENQEQQNSQGSQGEQNSEGKQQQQDADGDQEQKEEQGDVGHDTHSLWEKAIEERKKEQQEQSQQKAKNEKESKTETGDKEKQDDMQQTEQQTNEFTQKGEKEIFKQNQAKRRKQLQELSKELAKESSNEAGTGIQRQGRKLSDIGIAKPLIDWRKLLRQAVKHDEEWTRKNARMRNGYFRHRVEQIPIPETEIVLDTSGSVSETLLRNFLRECKNILASSKVKVGCFNTEFHGFTELRRIEDIDNMSFPIGGGTDFNAAVEAFSRRVSNKIIFTDGEARMPKKEVRNVIWVVFGNQQINPKGGKVIYISDEQLRRLYRYMQDAKSYDER